MPESYNPASVEGYFTHSSNNDGAYVNAGASGEYHVQNRSMDGTRFFFSKLNIEESNLEINWRSKGIYCFISTQEVIGEKRFVVECSEHKFFPIFNRLIARIIQDNVKGVRNIINIFRYEKSFWAGIPNPMTDEQALGLFGELYLMTEWFSHKVVEIIEQDFWTGPNGTAKDYNFDNFQIEVKTSRSTTSPVRHKISSLNQLQSEGVPLILYSLVAYPDQGGDFSLNDLVEEIRDILSPHSYAIEERFLELLKATNFVLGHPAMEKHRYSLTSGNGNFFAVSNQFPRLISEDDAEDERIHIESYSISLAGVDGLKLNLTSPIDYSSILNELSKLMN